MVSYDPAKVAFVDTETWGLDPEWHAVWEIAVIVDGVEHCWQQKSRSHNHKTGLPVAVDPYLLEHREEFGIDRYDWATATSWRESLLRFVDLVNGRHLIGACPWFDSERLHRLWLDHSRLDDGGYYRQPAWDSRARQQPWHYHLIDVENLAVGWQHGVRAGLRLEGMPDDLIEFEHPAPDLPWDSNTLSRLVGVDPDDFKPKHSALTDARWAKAIYEHIVGPPR